MRSRRLIGLAAVAAIATVALPATAAPAKPALHISDPAGDANGVNGQGFGAPVPSMSTSPASVSGADITGIDFRTNFAGKGKRRHADGFSVTLKLAAPLQKGVLITVTMDASAPCGPSNTIQLGYGTSSLAVCQTSGTTNDDIGSWEVSDDKTSITWDIAPVFKPGTTITNVNATTSVFVLGVFDEAKSSAIYKYGK